MKKRFEALKKDQKGFTLVELIVVLVILAILAALLVPALLGYIDKARNSKYLEEARSIYTAIQAVNDEKYAKVDDPVKLNVGTDLDKINNLVTPTEVISGTVGYRGTTEEHDKYTVSTLTDLIFKSQDANYVKISMDADGNWDTDGMDVGAALTDVGGSTTP